MKFPNSILRFRFRELRFDEIERKFFGEREIRFKTHQVREEKKRFESSRAFASPGIERALHRHLESSHSPFS